MKRQIIQINQDKCNGCGLCAQACHEGAIEMINGKAQLISDEYCDGLGNCLPACPTNAISIIEREASDYNEEKVHARQKAMKSATSNLPPFQGCPGSRMMQIERKTESAPAKTAEPTSQNTVPVSELTNWPIQLRLLPARAPYLDNAHLLIAADCTAFAYGDFHKEFVKGRIAIIACPKLDDNQYNVEKLTEILKQNNIASITAVRMEVPCCGGITSAVREAMLKASTIVPYREVTLSLDGKILP